MASGRRQGFEEYVHWIMNLNDHGGGAATAAAATAAAATAPAPQCDSSQCPGICAGSCPVLWYHFNGQQCKHCLLCVPGVRLGTHEFAALKTSSRHNELLSAEITKLRAQLEEQAARHTEEYYSWRNVATQYTTAQQKQREEQLDAQQTQQAQREEQLDAQQTQQAQREEQLDAQQKLEQRELDHLIHLHFDVV